ncbi:MAG: IS21-like element helper ATPase IstB [Pirellulaceae bacterium]
MTTPQQRWHEVLQRDLRELKLNQIAENYREVLDEAARQNTSMLQVLATLIASEVTARRQGTLERRIRQAKLPPRKTLEGYDFTFPKRIPKQRILRLFDCEFVVQHQCAVLIGKTGTGKSHLLNALGYTACEKEISVRWTRAIDMINVLTTAQINGTLEKRLREYTRTQLLLLDELGYLPIDKRGADLMFQVVAARYERGSIVITTNRVFREWGKIFDVDNTLATAIIDRLMHHGEALVIDGGSYRTRDQAEEE